ncbi:M13 family metallopeptidase [Stenotrophomonas tumulicola]
MPIDPTSARLAQGNHQRMHAGRAAPTRLATRQQRFGRPTPALNPHGVANLAALLLLASSALPRSTAVPLPADRGPADFPAHGGWPPGAGAADVSIAMHDIPAAAPSASADSPLLHPVVPSSVANFITDATTATCVRRPRHCGAALATGTLLLGSAGIGALLVHLLGHPDATEPAPSRFQLDPSALPPLPRFDAGEMDITRSPCQSLGAHVNARWEESAQLTPGRTREGTFDKLRDRSLLVRLQLAGQIAAHPHPDAAEKIIADLWTGGMDTAHIEARGIAPLLPQLQAIEQLTDRQTLFQHLFQIAAQGRNPLFALTVLPDLRHPSRSMAYLAQGGLGLPDSGWYAEPGRAPLVQAYQAHIARTLQLSGMPADEAVAAASNVLGLERKLAAASKAFAELTADVSIYYHPVSLEQARIESNGIDWHQFFQAQGIEAPDSISLGMQEFFAEAGRLLGSAPLDHWKAYLRFHALDAAAPYMSEAFVAAHRAFHDVALKGREGEIPRWARVLDIIERSAGSAFSKAYVDATLSPHSAQRMQALTSALHDALVRRLQAVPWMDDATRHQAAEKARRMRLEHGQPKRWQAWPEGLTHGQDFLHDVQAAQAFTHRHNINGIGQALDTDAWKMTPQTVDAYYDATQNRIVLPAALLQPPFFDPDADDALNFGGIAVIIAHEMAHGFDSLGSQFAADGSLRDGWSEDDHRRFNSLAARVEAQFGQYQVDGRPVDGALTLDENLADLGALAIAFDAMQAATAGIPDPMVDGMTRAQRFFANFAFSWRTLATPQRIALDMVTDNHAPGTVRADGAPSNMPAFAQAFNCTPGDPMARRDADRVTFL